MTPNPSSAPRGLACATGSRLLSRRTALRGAVGAVAGLVLGPHIGLAAEADTPLETVLGPIASSAVRNALAHEHMFVDFYGPSDPNYMNVDWDAVTGTCVGRALELLSLDVNLIIEWGNIGVGRNVLLLRDIARRTGLHIVCPTGIYKTLLPPAYVGLSVDAMAQRFIDELRRGVDNTRIKPGFIKIATTETGPTPAESLVHRASAIAARETGSTIALHSPHYVATRQVIATLDSEKLPLNRFVWGHAQPSKASEHKEVAARGATIQFDAISGHSDPFFNGPIDDASMLDRVEDMVKAGFGRQVLVSADASAFVNPAKYQYDRHPDYIPRYFAPKLAARLGADLARQVLRDNVLRAFRSPDRAA